MKNKILSLFLIVPLIMGACDTFDKGDVEKVYDGPDQVALFPVQDVTNIGCNAQSTSVEVQYISASGLASSDVSVNFSVGAASSAVAGTHYTIESSPVTIPAGSATTDIDINFIVTTLQTVNVTGAADTLRTAGTYSAVSATGGSGSGATFNVTVDDDGAAAVTVASGGTGYACTDTFTIADANLGGGGAADLTFAAQELTGSFSSANVSILLSLDGSDAQVSANHDTSNVFLLR